MAEFDAFLTEVGARIRLLREAAGMTQQQLAELVGMMRTSVANVEAGRQNLPLDRLGRFADALGVPPAALVGDVGADEASRTMAKVLSAERERFSAALAGVGRRVAELRRALDDIESAITEAGHG
jgi:transcriptional regulator with XRE-family HTH domain